MIQKILQFAVKLAGNGKSTVIDVDFSSDPVLFNVSPYSISGDYHISDTPIQGIIGETLKSSNGIPVTATVNEGIATFTFVKAPSTDVFTITGSATVSIPE